jgi:hypothetical protein
MGIKTMKFTERTMPIAYFLVVALGILAFKAEPAEAQHSPTNQAFQPITLPKGVVSLDLAPPDYGYMEHGEINEGRGLRVSKWEKADPAVGLGLGASYGISNDIEAGALLFPFIFSPESDFGDMELFGRYAFTHGNAQLAGQITLQIPTHNDFGLGFGIPARFFVSRGFMIDTGVELEIVFPEHSEDERVNLDLPLAFNFGVGSTGYLGFRSGILVYHMDDAAINLGFQGGFNVDPAVSLTASFNWPRFIWTGAGDAINPDTFEIVLGATIRFNAL